MSLQLTLGLDEIAAEIHRVWDETKAHQIVAWEGYFTTGRLLLDARQRFAEDDKGFGRWRKSQGFGFNRQWAQKLMAIARREEEARLLTSALVSKPPGVETVIALLGGQYRSALRAANRAKVALLPEPSVALAGQRFACIVIDPPWDVSDEGDVDQMGRAQPLYATMPIDEITALPIAEHSADDAHIYLWITNRSLPKGFDLLAAWGFRYVTCLTWCKPSIGIGNYFRNNTEHLLFGVRGSLPFTEHDQGTWFEAPRGPGGHSSKPDELYEIVRRVSPPPRLDWFARRGHEGFAAFGADAE